MSKKKYSKDLDETLVSKVKAIAERLHIENEDLKIEAIRLNKIGKDVGEIVKGNDLVRLFAGRDVIAIALLEEAFNQVDDRTKDLWIESLLCQIYYDFDKEKIVIQKPEINIPIGFFERYKEDAVKQARLAVLTIEQLKEQEKERKLAEKNKK